MFGIDWWTVLISGMASVFGGLFVLAGAFIAWGRYKEKVDAHENRFVDNNGKFEKHDSKLEKQAEKDNCLDSRICNLESKCIERSQLLSRNDTDHVEIFARLHALESGIAALPGRMSEHMDERFKTWREYLQADMHTIVYKIVYDNDQNKKD